MNDYPKEFMDWTAEQFGLECVDYQNEQCSLKELIADVNARQPEM